MFLLVNDRDEDICDNGKNYEFRRVFMAKILKMEENHEHLSHQEELRENFHNEVLISWEFSLKEPKYLTGEEVQDWLYTWGTDKEKEIPQCHG